MLCAFLIFAQYMWVCCAINKFECGYKQCPHTREGALNVHIVAHSHMDAGWVKTFDEYYYGTRTSVSTANVQLIYHSILSELLHDKRRKFTLSETAYFWRWWKEQRPATRATFRAMVQEGRIEFAGGGWVQNDEATVDYQAIIDMYTWGLRKLNDTLGPCGKPKAAWQIDSYGHTREQTSLMAQMGYDGLFIGRVDHKAREAMVEDDRMEFMWRGNDGLGKMSDIMTHTLFNLYNPPEGFCFDFLCNDEPIMDDSDSKAFNADKRVSEFIAQVERQAKYYDNDNILVTMGGDFTYQSAASWFMNLDKLMNYVNTHPTNMSDVNMFYSTPSCYLKALYLYGRRDKAIFMEKGDHVPYGSDAATYWTGYYTSRPSLKYFIKKGQAFLQVVKQLTVIVGLGDTYELHLLRHAVALLLHHDAITGTSQQHVANDFSRILNEAIEANTKKISGLLSILTPSWGGSRRSKNHQQFVVCHQLNISQCRLSESQESFLVLLYNPASVKTGHYVRLPVAAPQYAVKDLNDDYVEHQLVPLPPAAVGLPGRKSSAIQELFFEAENIPPLGYSAFYVTAVHDDLREKEFTKQPQAFEDVETTSMISNEYLKVTIDKQTGLLESVQHVDGVKIQVSQNFFSYCSKQASMHSGAYSFRPSQDAAVPVTGRATPRMLRGPLVQEVRQRFSDWLTQVIRLYRGEEFVEFEWIVGPVPVGPDLGKEVVTRFSTNITSNGQFLTDSNGRQMMKRSCWNESAGHFEKKSKAACYFPVTSRICIHSINTSVEMCVLTDRAQGGTSYNEGEVELMIHRRLLTDDGFGLEEPLNEEAYGLGLVVTGKHRMYLGNYRQDPEDQSFVERVAAAARRWRLEPCAFLAAADQLGRRKWAGVRNKRFSALRPHALPRHVQVLTLEPWRAGSVLLRLENTMLRSNKPDFVPSRGQHTTVDLRKLFLTLRMRRIRETTLAANQWLDEARQMDWSTRYVYSGGSDGIAPEDNVDYTDDLKPSKDGDQLFDEDRKFGGGEKTRRTKGTGQYYSSYPADQYRRRKRSYNTSEDLQDNVINRTSGDNSQLALNDSYVEVISSQNEQGHLNRASRNRIVATMSPHFFVSKQRSDMQRKRSKSIDYVYKDSGEIASSEENFSGNLKRVKGNKRGRFTKKRKGQQVSTTQGVSYSPFPDDVDVTKSVYDMYYKNDRPLTATDTSSSEEYLDAITKPITDKLRKPAQRRPRTEDRRVPRSRKKNGVSVVAGTGSKLGFRQEWRVRRTSLEELSGEEEYESWSQEVARRNGRVRPRSAAHEAEDYPAAPPPNPAVSGLRVDDEDIILVRRKRSENKQADMEPRLGPRRHRNLDGSDASNEPQYLVTLRPSQIRTFVVWFEKKTAV